MKTNIAQLVRSFNRLQRKIETLEARGVKGSKVEALLAEFDMVKHELDKVGVVL